MALVNVTVFWLPLLLVKAIDPPAVADEEPKELKVKSPAALKSRVEATLAVPFAPNRLLELEIALLLSNLTIVLLPEMLTLPTAALLLPDIILVPPPNAVLPV